MKHMASIYRKPSSVPAAPEDPEEEILLYVVGVPHLYIFSTYVIKRKQDIVGLHWARKYVLFFFVVLVHLSPVHRTCSIWQDFMTSLLIF